MKKLSLLTAVTLVLSFTEAQAGSIHFSIWTHIDKVTLSNIKMSMKNNIHITSFEESYNLENDDVEFALKKYGALHAQITTDGKVTTECTGSSITSTELMYALNVTENEHGVFNCDLKQLD